MKPEQKYLIKWEERVRGKIRQRERKVPTLAELYKFSDELSMKDNVVSVRMWNGREL